jgi:plastocyanin domain-containing protein
METTEWLVLLGGAAAIAWVNWYFFVAGRGVAASVTGAGGVQEVRIEVAGGYSPSVVQVRRGAPVRLIFDRRETSGCSEEVVLGDFGIRKYLPAHEETVVEFTPEDAGAFEFTCGMGMLRGRIVVE